MAIYPPIMASSQDAFLASSAYEPIEFTLSSVTNRRDIRHVQIKIVYQKNNKTAVNTSLYPDGIIYKPDTALIDLGNNRYQVSIYSNELEAGWWIPNKYYKVQICFGSADLWTGDLSSFATWKAAQVEQNGFSDWSTVMVIKAIATPQIKITNNGAATGGGDLIIESSIDTELTTTPLFQGTFDCPGEPEDKYKFDLYNSEYELLETTGWLQKKQVGGIDTHRFKTILEDTKSYIVGYEVITVNGYHSIASNYEFSVNQNFLTKLQNIRLIVSTVVDEETMEPYGDENGVMKIILDTDGSISGNYVLTRSSERSNYAVWEDLKFFNFTDREFKNELLFQDFTVESGIKYKYAFQQENLAGLRTEPIYESSSLIASPERMVNYKHSYLLRGDVQLKLMLDHKVSSFKRTVLANKQDTLGSKYPTINRNGDAYYAEFPITGIISLHGDDYNTFFEKRTDGYYYKGERVIKPDKYLHPDDQDIDTYDTNLTDNNFFIERIFRDKVEEFLNDGNPKLYKSPAEGSMVVALMNVSMTPQIALGRMIFAFSAMAYEIMDATMENLDEYDIIHIGSVEENESLNRATSSTVLTGQIAGLFKAGQNLMDLIREQNEYSIGGNYQYVFMGINSLRIEGYPDVDLQPEINKLQVELIQARQDKDEDLIASLESQIKDRKELQAALENQVAYPIITVNINQKEITLGQNKIYQLKDSEPVTTLSLKYTQPVIINYTCSVVSQESESSTVSAVVTSSAWGQVAGVFTETRKILNNYQLMRDASEFEIVNLTNHNYGVYQSLSITDVIRQQVQHYIEDLYKTKFHPEKDGEGHEYLTDGRIRYEFQKFLNIEIEADEGTSFIIHYTNGKEQRVLMGYTNKYRLEDSDNMIQNIVFEQASFAIVNYRCLTMQMQMGGK